MLRQADSQKKEEEYWARQAALKLDEPWDLFSRERPDFRVTSTADEFGLEVTECHIGPESGKGSSWRAAEGNNTKVLEAARRKYERATGISLNLKYLGPVNQTAMDELVNALQKVAFDRPEDLAKSTEIGFASGKAWAHRATNPHWIVVRDGVGWVSRNEEYLQREIDKKARKLPIYREAYSDIRLLVVANRIHNSGKLILEERFRPNLRGFNAVYFFSYPERVTPFYFQSD